MFILYNIMGNTKSLRKRICVVATLKEVSMATPNFLLFVYTF
jgi:hypothetical protein